MGESACCALTWVSTGQLDAARRILGRTVATLHAYAAAGVPVLALEPSCLATLRSDAAELLDDPRVAEVAAQHPHARRAARPDSPGWTPPDLTGTEVVVQPHCHHASVLGWEADARLLARTGATVTRVDGCCGLAGNFGVERGHYEVSVAVAETHLLPAVRAAGPGAVVLADGFSCRTQLDDLAGVGSVHLAELLNRRGRTGDRERAEPPHYRIGAGAVLTLLRRAGNLFLRAWDTQAIMRAPASRVAARPAFVEGPHRPRSAGGDLRTGRHARPRGKRLANHRSTTRQSVLTSEGEPRGAHHPAVGP